MSASRATSAQAPMVTAQSISMALNGKKSGSGWKACCPAHDDHAPSLSIKDGENGPVWNCLAGCTKEAVTTALVARGLWRGWKDGSAKPIAKRPTTKPPATPDWLPMMPPPVNAPKPLLALFHGFSTTYEYCDQAGEPLFYIRRKEATATKAKQFMPLTFGSLTDGKTGEIITGWHTRQPDAPRPLYGLNRLAARPDAPVMLCEGEKDADAAAILFPDYVAMAWPCGSQAVSKTDWTPLLDRDVAMFPDADAPGAKAAKEVQGKLRQARLVRVDDLAGGAGAADLVMTPVEAAEWLQERLQGEVDGQYEPLGDPDHVEEDDADNDAAELARALAEKCRAAVTATVDEFNRKFMVVNEAGKAVIFQPGYDPVLKRKHYDRLAIRDLIALYMNQMIEVGQKPNGDPIIKSKADVWLRHHNRRQFIDGVVFDPSSTDPRPGVLNLWEGYAVQPVKGDWSLLRDHIEKIVCGNDPTRYNYLLAWIARMLQFPGQQGETAVVMRSTEEGTGKGTVAKALLKIMGQHGLAISNSKHLVGNFNGHLRDAVFLFADEAFFAGDRAAIGTLKSLITEPYITVEAKHQNAVQQPNYLHVMMSSNEDWVVPAGRDARRFFVLEVSNAKLGDYAYFNALQAQMNAGGYEAMLYDLLDLNIDTFNVRDVPVTSGLQQQKALSLPTAEAWWRDCLERGYVFRSKIGLEAYFTQWSNKISTELLFASYTEFATGRRERDPISREALGVFMRRMGGRAIRPTNTVVGEHLTEESGHYGAPQRVAKTIISARSWGYSLGDLNMAQEDFDKATGLAVDWPRGDPDEEHPKA